MAKVRHLLEVALFKRNKAYCLLRDAPFMPLAEDRARLILYAKFFEEEAVKLEAQARDPSAGASDCESKRGTQLEPRRPIRAVLTNRDY